MRQGQLLYGGGKTCQRLQSYRAYELLLAIVASFNRKQIEPWETAYGFGRHYNKQLLQLGQASYDLRVLLQKEGTIIEGDQVDTGGLSEARERWCRCHTRKGT